MTDHTPARLRELADMHQDYAYHYERQRDIARYTFARETATALRAAADRQEADAKAIAEMRGMLAMVVKPGGPMTDAIEHAAEYGPPGREKAFRTLAAEIAALLGDDDAPAS